jgi:hypothetical protein
MKIKTRCPCCDKEIWIDIDLSHQEQELSVDEQKEILNKIGIEFG